MMLCKPIVVPKGAFTFCKYGVSALLWVAWIWQVKALVIAAAVILALSAIFTVRNAPLVLLYRLTVERLFPSRDEILDEYGMRFAHTLGAVMAGVAAVLLYVEATTHSGWVFLLIFAGMKTLGALGFCAASKLYGCIARQGGACCGIFNRQQSCPTDTPTVEP